MFFKIPRIQVEASKYRKELKQTGVCFLFGSTGDKEVDKDSVYIGQAGLRANREGLLFHVNEYKNDEIINDILFNSPSGAASFVSGTSVNDMKCWKTEDGVTLQKITSNE